MSFLGPIQEIWHNVICRFIVRDVVRGREFGMQIEGVREELGEGCLRDEHGRF